MTNEWKGMGQLYQKNYYSSRPEFRLNILFNRVYYLLPDSLLGHDPT